MPPGPRRPHWPAGLIMSAARSFWSSPGWAVAEASGRVPRRSLGEVRRTRADPRRCPTAGGKGNSSHEDRTIGALGRVGAAAHWLLIFRLRRTRPTAQISGEGADQTAGECGSPPAGYGDFADFTPLVLTGDLDGCLYTNILTSTDRGAPSGIYIETGREVVVASLNGGPLGTFKQLLVRVSGTGRVDRRGGQGTLPAPDRRGVWDRRLRGCDRPARLQGRGRDRAVLLPRAHQARLTHSASSRTSIGPMPFSSAG